jgi:DNA-binding winged helix-turn-helix (wHTH) protein
MNYTLPMASRPEDATYEFEGFRLETRSRLLTRTGTNQHIALTPRQFETLVFLVERAGTLVDKEELMQVLWPDSVVAENNLNQHISALRGLLGEDRGGRRFIMNVRAKGYRFVPDVMRIDRSAEVPVQRRGSTSNLAAWQCFQHAMFLLGMDDPRQWADAMERLSQAVELDPEFASALAVLAQVRIRLATVDWPGGKALLDQAEQEAGRAVKLRPDLAFAHMAVGSVAAARGDWCGGERSFLAASSLDEDWPMVRAMHVAHVLLSVGHLERAAQLIEGEQRAHGMIGIVLIEAMTFLLLDREAEAARAMSLIKSLGGKPHQPHLANLFVLAALRDGRPEEAARLLVASVPEAKRAAATEETIALIMTAIATGKDPERAVHAIDGLVPAPGIAAIANPFRFHILEWYARLGEVDRAFDYSFALLDSFREQGTAGIFWGQLWLREMRDFRRDERFGLLASRLGFSAYWRQFGPPDAGVA